mgnify:CR=1 FL=1
MVQPRAGPARAARAERAGRRHLHHGFDVVVAPVGGKADGDDVRDEPRQRLLQHVGQPHHVVLVQPHHHLVAVVGGCLETSFWINSLY